MDKRFITVKGVGHAQVRPDQAEISFVVARTEKKFDKSVNAVSDAVDNLRQTIVGLGFDKTDLKTTDWNSEQIYKDRRGGARSRLLRAHPDEIEGYKTTHELKLTFGLNDKNVSIPDIISAIAACDAKPEFIVNYTIKEKSDLAEQVLADAAKNARAKAKIIAEASGVQLGDPIRIEYDWSEYHFFSDTKFDSSETMLCDSADEESYAKLSLLNRMAVAEPEDITLRDTIRFMWELA
jgi:uncharacterized protein YggE